MFHLLPSRFAPAFALAAGIFLAATGAHAKEWTDVRIGVEGTFPPWNLTDASGKLSGLDIDLTNDLCRRAKLKCELIAGDWSSMIPSLNAGKFDLVLTMGVNETRKKVIDFTIPYASGVATFLVTKDGGLADLPQQGVRLNLNDKAATDPVMAAIHQRLKGKIIGVVQGTSQEQLIHLYFGDDVTVHTYKASPERDLDLLAGRVDAGFDSGVYATATQSRPDHENLVMAGPLLKGSVLATEVALGLRKGEPELKAIFDTAIAEAAADGTIRALSVKWSKLDLTPTTPAP